MWSVSHHHGAALALKADIVPLKSLPVFQAVVCIHRFPRWLSASVGDIGDTDLIPGSGRSPGEGHSNPLQYSCRESPMDRGAWRATVRGVT